MHSQAGPISPVNDHNEFREVDQEGSDEVQPSHNSLLGRNIGVGHPTAEFLDSAVEFPETRQGFGESIQMRSFAFEQQGGHGGQRPQIAGLHDKMELLEEHDQLGNDGDSGFHGVFSPFKIGFSRHYCGYILDPFNPNRPHLSLIYLRECYNFSRVRNIKIRLFIKQQYNEQTEMCKELKGGAYNKTYKGTTPLKLTELQKRTYYFSIEKEGYEILKEKVVLSKNKSVRYTLSPFKTTSHIIPTPTSVPTVTPIPIVAPTSTPKPFVSEKRIALVIGNSNYHDLPLRNPVNDAQDLAHVLSSLGFQVTIRTNLNQQAMEEAIHTFSEQIRHGDVALFYFSGHGSQVRGMNYLIPVQERIRSASDIRYKAVNAGYILGKMEEAGNKTNIIILDACRNNPFKGFKSQNQGFAPMAAPRGTFIAYGTAPGSVAWESPNARNSIYTKHLLNALTQQGSMIEQAFKHVLRGVEDETHGQQTPWTASSLRGDFYFNP